jgi:hypothetical protein
MQVSRGLVHSRLVSLASDILSASHFQSQTLLALQKSKPIQIFSVVGNFPKGILPHGVPNKIDDCACSFQSIGFQRVSCNGKLALLTVSSCKEIVLKRAGWSNC